MQEGELERIKRRRLNGDEEHDLPLSQERRFQAAAAVEAPNNADLTNLLLRQRILEQQQQQQADVERSRALARVGAADQLLTGAGAAADPMVAHLRQNLFNQQLAQQAARLQAVAAADADLSYLRGASDGGLYASLLGPTGSHPALTANSLLSLGGGNETTGAGSSAPSLAEQISARGRRGSSIPGGAAAAWHMQSLLEAEREQEAAVAAADGGSLRQLLGLPSAESASNGASILVRLQNERAMAVGRSAGMGGTAFSPAALHSLISRAPLGTTTAAGATLAHDLLFARGNTGAGVRPPPNPYLGALSGGNLPGRGPPLPPKEPEPPKNPNMTGRQPIHLFMSCDMDDLSPYQCLVRKQIELFEAQEIDAETNARGRNRPIVVGQVGIRCKHCKMLPPRKRERAAIYYPSKLDRLYQAGQTMASVHLGQHCNHIPEHLRQELARLREGKSAALAGKKYWSDGARALGVIEEDERLFFKRD